MTDPVEPSGICRAAIIGAALALAACQPAGENAVTAEGAENFAAIAPDETIRLTGTEPFWGGEIDGHAMLYTTPENQAGTRIGLTRFAGLGGLGLSGELDGDPFDVAITEEACSDGMSDRTYPFAVTLIVRGETRQGCAWTEARPFAGPANP